MQHFLRESQSLMHTNYTIVYQNYFDAVDTIHIETTSFVLAELIDWRDGKHKQNIDKYDVIRLKFNLFTT